MQTYLAGRDMITTQEWTRDELDTVFEVAFDLKRKRALGEPHPLLRDKVLAMLFFFSSTRTRVSFEAGMAQLGGHAQYIDSRTTQIAHGDTGKEIGEIIGRYCDGIAIRQVDWGIGNAYFGNLTTFRHPGPSRRIKSTFFMASVARRQHGIYGCFGLGKPTNRTPFCQHRITKYSALFLRRQVAFLHIERVRPIRGLDCTFPKRSRQAKDYREWRSASTLERGWEGNLLCGH